MGTLLDRFKFWHRAAATPIWHSRIERERTAIGRFNDNVQQRLDGQVSPKTLHDLLVAFDELLTNVLMHATQAAGPIEVELCRDRRAVRVSISYLASEFDPTAWRPAASGATIAASRIGGLGITLVRTLMDEFKYEYVDGRNVVTLVKRI